MQRKFQSIITNVKQGETLTSQESDVKKRLTQKIKSILFKHICTY